MGPSNQYDYCNAYISLNQPVFYSIKDKTKMHTHFQSLTVFQKAVVKFANYSSHHFLSPNTFNLILEEEEKKEAKRLEECPAPIVTAREE